MSKSWVLALAAGLGAVAVLPAPAQDDGSAPESGEGRAWVERAVEAMGGREALDAVATAVLAVDPGGRPVRERHSIVLEDRRLHYASRRGGGAGFDVVLAPGLAFLCDRAPDGRATYVEDLAEADAREGAYERDILFMPLVLDHLLEDEGARLDYRGPNSQGDPVVRALVRPSGGGPGQPFVIRLRIDQETHLLHQSMGIVPIGADEGRKRYFSYLDWEEAGSLKLPTRYADQRGKDTPAREFRVDWDVNAEIEPALFLRPNVPHEDDG